MGDFDLGLLDDDTYKVEVLRTKMLGIAEVFMYRLPSKCKSPYRWEQKKSFYSGRRLSSYAGTIAIRQGIATCIGRKSTKIFKPYISRFLCC